MSAVCGYEAVLDAAELDRSPSSADLPGDPPRLDRLGRVATLLGGFALATAGTGLALLLVSVPGRDMIVPAALIVLGAVVLRFLPRVSAMFDIRIVTGLAAALMVVVLIVPPERATHLGGRIAVGAIAVAFTLLTVRLWRQLRTASREAEAWNSAYRALASAPRRATRTEADVQLVPLGRGHSLEGTVTFVDADGEEQVVPLTTMRVMRVVLTGQQKIVEPLRYAVWHDPANSIVLTRVLLAEQ